MKRALVLILIVALAVVSVSTLFSAPQSKFYDDISTKQTLSGVLLNTLHGYSADAQCKITLHRYDYEAASDSIQPNHASGDTFYMLPAGVPMTIHATGVYPMTHVYVDPVAQTDVTILWE